MRKTIRKRISEKRMKKDAKKKKQYRKGKERN